MKILLFINNFLKRRIPIYTVLFISILVGGIVNYFLVDTNNIANGKSDEKVEYNTCITKMSQIRIKEYKFIHPLLLTDIPNESDEFSALKTDITAFIESKRALGELTNASVYIRKLDNGSWTNINGNEGFHPGSMIKVPILLTYLKFAESNPSLLNKQITYEKPYSNMPNQEFPEESIVVGKTYKVSELLEAMIERSDNAATMLLIQNVNMNGFKKLFTDLGLPEPPENNPDFKISAVDVSKFFRVLYSSTYLNTASSEYALSILSKSTFKQGITNSLPKEILVSHKFGEQGTDSGKELHEMAIVYLHDGPYLITVMTQGKEMKLLPPIISEISKITYNHLNTNI